MGLDFSIYNFFINKQWLANKWMSFSCSNSALLEGYILNQTKNIKYIVISWWYLIKWTIVSWLDGSTWWHKVNMCFFADMRMHYITTYILCKWVSAESTFSVSCSISLVEWWKVGTQPLPVGQCFAACFCY